MKILVIRFSSIGDIILTTPVVRSLANGMNNAEIHYITKKQFAFLLESNPYCKKIHSFEKEPEEILAQLKSEKFDLVIDLHNNLRSLRLKWKLGCKSTSFKKLNVEKWLMVNFKMNRLPQKHIVERYYETVSNLGLLADNKGLDYFIPEKDEVNVSELPGKFPLGFHALVVGGSYYTKRIPEVKLQEIIESSDLPVVLLGGKEDFDLAKEIEKSYHEKVLNLCGKLNFNQSASLIKQAQKVITSDTGLMHVAAAFNKEIHSLWGNTIPEFGMSPYLPNSSSKIHEVKNLNCRPCSKLGYSKCPKGHFNCMMKIEVGNIFK